MRTLLDTIFREQGRDVDWASRGDPIVRGRGPRDALGGGSLDKHGKTCEGAIAQKASHEERGGKEAKLGLHSGHGK